MLNFYKVGGRSQFYSALLKAENLTQAVKHYHKFVCEIETEADREELLFDMKELSFAEVVSELRGSQTEDGRPLTDTEILDQLVDNDTILLIVDSALL